MRQRVPTRTDDGSTVVSEAIHQTEFISDSSDRTAPSRGDRWEETEEITPIRHGGDLDSIRARYGLDNLPLVDFSVSINAIGMTKRVWEAAWAAFGQSERYPVTGCPRLVEAIAQFHDVPKTCVLVGAGTTELIRLLAESQADPMRRRAERLGRPEAPLAHLIEPSYAEYRRCSALARLRPKVWPTEVIGWTQSFAPPEGAIGIHWTGHPNNPTGRAWNRSALLDAVDRGGPHLITAVDEAYLQFLPDEADRTVVNEVVRRDNLIVFRSMTKFYAMPGLRVGYAVGSPNVIERMRARQDPWTVAAPAEAAARVALEETPDYAPRVVASVLRESRRVLDHLWDFPGIRPVWPGRERPADAPGLPNFLLISVTEDSPWTSQTLHEALARRGVVTRECSNYRGLEIGSVLRGPGLTVPTRGHLRFAIRSLRENDLLLTQLRDLTRSSLS